MNFKQLVILFKDPDAPIGEFNEGAMYFVAVLSALVFIIFIYAVYIDKNKADENDKS